MTTYKLFRIREGRLFPLYVEHTREMNPEQRIDGVVVVL